MKHKTMENNPMNQDVFAGQWKQMRGELKSWWGKLADDDFDRIEGQKDKLIGAVQEKYGYAREKAQQEVEGRFKEYSDKMSGPNSSGKRDTAAAGAGEPATTPHEGPIATAVAAVAGGVESAQGAISTAATAVAGGVESASSYLQEKKIRRDGNRHHRLDTPASCPSAIGWSWPWLSPGPTHLEVNHG
jgi:uncharacterized protein YjbJ (UPF0337 family)